jgi:hypothetical protein
MRRRDGIPAWLVFLIAVALVFGVYYVWTGIRDFLRTGGLGITEATQRAAIVTTATVERRVTQQAGAAVEATRRPTSTPVPECMDFVVNVPVAVVRSAPSTRGDVVVQLRQGETVCVVGRASENSEWYLIDSNPRTRALEAVYMHQDIIEAMNPTPTPSRTMTPLPTVTPTFSLTPSESPVPTIAPTMTPSPTNDPNLTDTPTPTITPSPTPLMRSA